MDIVLKNADGIYMISTCNVLTCKFIKIINTIPGIVALLVLLSLLISHESDILFDFSGVHPMQQQPTKHK